MGINMSKILVWKKPGREIISTNLIFDLALCVMGQHVRLGGGGGGGEGRESHRWGTFAI